MDIPDIKTILQKLSVLKNNVSLLVSIIIALIAVLLFVPAKLWSSSLKERVNRTSVMMGNKVKSELRDAVSREQGKEVAKREAVYQSDANQIAILARQSTERELLSYDIFPSRKDSSALIFKVFGERYRVGIDGALKRMNASDCPTEAELSRGVTNASASSSSGGAMPPSLYSVPSRSPYSSSSSRSPYSSSARSPYSRPGVGAYDMSSGAAGGVESTIRDEICLSRAKSCSVYGNPLDVAGYAFWGEYKYDVQPEDAIQDCWYYQLGYWVIEDVFATINSMNSGSSDVLTAPVKRVLSIGFGGGSIGGTRSASPYSPYGGRATMSSGTMVGGDRPSYVTALQPGLAVDSCTGRVSDGNNIDVIHFKAVVVVSVKSILPFMKELCSAKQHRFNGFFNELGQAKPYSHNQITVLESKFTAVDRSDAFHSLYRYGQDAVVELELVCEYVFDAKAYNVIKPQVVKGEPPADGQQPFAPLQGRGTY
jgi:hypothetical protein